MVRVPSVPPNYKDKKRLSTLLAYSDKETIKDRVNTLIESGNYYSITVSAIYKAMTK